MVLSTSRRMISTALSKFRAIREHARVLASPQHGGLPHNVCYAKIVALQLAIYQRLCLNGRFMRRSVLSRVLLTFFVTLHLPFAWIYHVPRDSYNYSALPHGSGQASSLKINWLSWRIMMLSFKWLRCNDSHFRMGALECHQSQEVAGKLAVSPHRKKGWFFSTDFGLRFFYTNPSQILESLTDFRVDFLFYTDSRRFE